MNRTRRSTLAGLVGAGTVGIAGCAGDSVVGSLRETGDDAETGDEEDAGGSAPPTGGDARHLAYDADEVLRASLNGGVGQDGIPSIDEPSFEPIGDATFGDDLPVFGVARDGEAKAYPQHLLVWHEIVNDEIAGDPVSVTYCPLTGTAQGFSRGETTFGVSGELVNSNLIMYDRATESWWPQMLATAIDGPMAGETLREFRVVWTTAGEWAARHPDSLVMTDETGYVRRYDDDPYGGYAPLHGYYKRDGTMFEPLSSPDAGHSKSVVVGARTDAGAIAFDKETLLKRRTLTGRVAGDGRRVVAVSDPRLSTGYVYENPDGLRVEPNGETYGVDGSGDGFEADDLPLERVLAFDAMWFAWAGFYPQTAFVGEHTDAGDGR